MELLVEGNEAFKYIKEKIEKAKNKILIHMFIWRDDIIGNEILDTLLKAAKRNVKIDIIKDSLGAVFEYSEENRQSLFHKKINFEVILKAKILNFFYKNIGKGSYKQKNNELLNQFLALDNVKVQFNKKLGNHSKFFIIDDKILIIGGINIEDKEWLRDLYNRKYHDYMIAFDGIDIVNQFKNRLFNNVNFNINSEIEFIFNKKNGILKNFNIKKHILEILDRAKKEIVLIMAYFGDKDIIKKLIELDRNGIKIFIILPMKANLQQDLNMAIMRYLLNKTKNLKIYFNPKMVHSKLILVDNLWLTIGSCNLNKQAMKELQELNVLIKMPEDIKNKLKKVIKREKRLSKKIDSKKNIKFNIIRNYIEKYI